MNSSLHSKAIYVDIHQDDGTIEETPFIYKRIKKVMAWSLKKNWLYEGIKLAQYWLIVFSRRDNSKGVKVRYGNHPAIPYMNLTV